jgi:hypothetical protein
MGYEWTVTFTNKTVGTDVELFTSSCNQLAGTGVDLSISESEKGNELAGSFALSYNGDLTPGIAYDADAATVQAALNALHSIYPSKVDVTRTAVTTDDRAQVKGYTWSITFDSSTWHDPTGKFFFGGVGGGFKKKPFVFIMFFFNVLALTILFLGGGRGGAW